MISLLPIGDVEEATLETLGQSLAEVLGSKIEIGDRLLAPQSRGHRRGQYLASALLALVPSPASGDRALGVVYVDLYAPGLNFVFGQADIAGKRAVISLWRLRQEFYGLPGDAILFMERSLKEAVHELGHTYGLGHCPNPRCVMHFSNSLRDTDIKGSDFCAVCQAKVGQDR